MEKVKNQDGKKEYQGILKEFDSEYIMLDDLKIERKNISQIKTIYLLQENCTTILIYRMSIF